MRVPLPVLFALPVAAGALAWFLLVRTEAGSSAAGEHEERSVRRDGAALESPPVARTLPRADVVPVESEDTEWITRPLALPAGKGPLKGSDLIQAVEAAGKVRLRGATEADLDALRRAVFEDVDRESAPPYAAMMGWLKEAGFEVEVAYPTLTVRRRTDDDWAGR